VSRLKENLAMHWPLVEGLVLDLTANYVRFSGIAVQLSVLMFGFR